MSFRDEALQCVDWIIRSKDQDYIGEEISQLEHALQSAHLALEANGSDELIIASLFHDIGHLCAHADARRMDIYGVDCHHTIGAAKMREFGFPAGVTRLIEGHVEAKRYLVAKNPRYLQDLSGASQETLKRQGGPMTQAEMKAFEEDPLFKDMLRLRVFDDRAKEVGKKVPPFEYYYDRIFKLIRSSKLE